MSTYTPDVWVVIKIKHGGEVIDKVLAGWYGGYLDGDSWKISSGITETVEFDDRYEFYNYSGSTYVCYKEYQKLSGMTQSIYEGLLREMEEINDPTSTKVELVKF